MTMGEKNQAFKKGKLYPIKLANDRLQDYQALQNV